MISYECIGDERMFKSPISKTGDIRYFELIKIFILVIVFYALFTKYVLVQTSMISDSSFELVSIMTILFIIQLYLACFEGFKQLKEYILSRVLKYIHVKRITLKKQVFNLYNNTQKSFYIQKELYKLNCSIRC